MNRADNKKVITDDEMIRRRQCILLVAFGVVFPAYRLISCILSDQFYFDIADGLLSLISFAMIALGLFYYYRTRYFVEKNTTGNEWIYVCPSRDNSAKDIERRQIPHSAMQHLEMIWFPLHYPEKTVIKFQVRTSQQTELVFLTTTSEAKAKKTMNKLAKSLTANTEDQTWNGPVKNVPKHYLLSKAEQKPGSKVTNIIIFLILSGFGAAFYFAGQSSGEGQIVGIIIMGIAALFPLGWLLKILPKKKPPKKFSRWLP